MQRTAIEIEAGEAFGTAHNATTVLCLELVDVLVRIKQVGRALDCPGGAKLFANIRKAPAHLKDPARVAELTKESVAGYIRNELAMARLAKENGARFILAHAAVSDLAWLWRLMPENPNLFIDSSWWNPADFVALFSLVPPGQILWASDNPYGQPLFAAAFQLRYALLVGLSGDQIRTIAGGQIERILAGA